MLVFVNKNGSVRSVTSGAQYDGEKMPGDLAGWNALSDDSNLILTSTYGELVKRSLTLYHTYAPAIGAIDKQVDYAIGPGLVFRSQPDYTSLNMDRESAKEWGKDFQKIVHYYMQQMSMYEKQSVLMRGGLAAGDSLLFFDRTEDGSLNDIIEMQSTEIDWRYNTETHTLGINHDKYLRRMGYRSNSGGDIPFKNSAGDQNVLMYMEKKLPRQLRGYPLMYSIINLAKNDDRHTDAATHRAVMETILLGWTETDNSNPIKQAESMARRNRVKVGHGLTPQPESLLKKIGNSFRLGSGNMFQFSTGEKMNFSELKTPNNTFKDFKGVIIEYIGMATGTPAEVIMSKYNTSYTAHRGAFNDFIKSYTRRRKHFERTVMMPVITEIAKDAILKGFIQAPGFFDNPMTQSAYLQGMFLGPVPGAINPLQEVNADIRRVDNAFMLRSDIASQYGNEWDNFITEWADEQAEFVKSSPEKQAEIVQKEVINEK